MKKLLMAFAAFCMTVNASAQFGQLSGTVYSSQDGQPLPGATIAYYDGGVLKGTATDGDGRYTIKPLSPGVYSIIIRFVGCNQVKINDIQISDNKITFVDATLEPDNFLPEVEIGWESPLIDPGNVSSMEILTAEEIETAVSRDINDLAATTGGVYQQEEGGSLNVRGSRDNATQYVVDGVKMTGPFSLPKSAIAEITVLTGGIPAQFGDATGGIILITTKSYWNNKR